jgi:hypothetical protein
MLLVGRHSTDSIRVSYFDQRDGYQYFPLLELSPPHGEFELTALLDGDAFDAGPGPTYLPIDILLDFLSQKFDVAALPVTSNRSRGMLNLANLKISHTQNIFCNL